MATKLDLRIQEFCQQDVFVFTTILQLSKELNKKMELNIWVDSDLNFSLLIKSFPTAALSLIETVYYRFDDSSCSRHLRQLMKKFECADLRF